MGQEGVKDVPSIPLIMRGWHGTGRGRGCPVYTYDHEGEQAEADGQDDVLCHVALPETLLQHRLVPEISHRFAKFPPRKMCSF